MKKLLLILMIGTTSLVGLTSCRNDKTAKERTEYCNVQRTFNGHKQRYHFQFSGGGDLECSMDPYNGYWEDVK